MTTINIKDENHMPEKTANNSDFLHCNHGPAMVTLGKEQAGRIPDFGCDWEWETVSLAGREANNIAHREEAAHYWQRAYEISQGFDAHDPRRAASLNNLALVEFANDNIVKAEKLLRLASKFWATASLWIAAMQTSHQARSSLFHQRMEQRHATAFEVVKRAAHLDELQGAVCLTEFNLSVALLLLDKDDEADRLLENAADKRKKTCGGRNPELGMILTVLASRLEMGAKHQAAQECSLEAQGIFKDPARTNTQLWLHERPKDMNETRRVLAAIHLTCPLHEREFL